MRSRGNQGGCRAVVKHINLSEVTCAEPRTRRCPLNWACSASAARGETAPRATALGHVISNQRTQQYRHDRFLIFDPTVLSSCSLAPALPQPVLPLLPHGEAYVPPSGVQYGRDPPNALLRGLSDEEMKSRSSSPQTSPQIVRRFRVDSISGTTGKCVRPPSFPGCTRSHMPTKLLAWRLGGEDS